MPTPPSAMARPGASPFGSTSAPPACASRAVRRLAPTLVEQRDRRHVERQLQRAAHRHRALERQIEILRRIGAVADRAVLDQRFGMRDAVLEGEPVDERLQRRAGRAQRLGHVDLAGAALVEIIGRRDARQHLAGRIVDREDRDRDDRGRARAPARAPGLRGSSASGASMVSRWILLRRRRRDGLIGGMRRERRHRPARRPAPASSLAQRDLVGRHAARPRRCGRARGRAPLRAAAAERSGRRSSGDCGSATSSAASASDSRRGSLPK